MFCTFAYIAVKDVVFDCLVLNDKLELLDVFNKDKWAKQNGKYTCYNTQQEEVSPDTCMQYST